MLDIRVTQSVERNVRKLIGWLLVCIVAIYGILEGGVGCGVAHHGAIRLGKEPVVALPVGTQRFLCFGLLDHHAVEPVCQESGDADLSAGVFRFRCFADLLAVHYCCGFGDADGAVLKVNIRPLQRQHFSFPQPGEDRQIKKNSELFWHGSGQRVITNLILDAGIIHPAVPSCMDFVGFLDVFQEAADVCRREEFDFISDILAMRPNLIAGIPVYDFPVHSSFENGGEDIRSFCDGSLAVASRLSIPPDTAFCHGNIEAVYIVGLDFRQDHMPKHRKNLIVDFGVVLFQCTRLQILRGVFLSPSVNKLTKGSFFSRKNQTVFYAVLKLDGKCLDNLFLFLRGEFFWGCEGGGFSLAASIQVEAGIHGDLVCTIAFSDCCHCVGSSVSFSLCNYYTEKNEIAPLCQEPNFFAAKDSIIPKNGEFSYSAVETQAGSNRDRT